MPNWCDNTVSITGPDGVIKKLVEFVGRPVGEGKDRVEEPVFSLANIKPSTSDIDPKYYFMPTDGEDDWYHNNINSWGTKWDVFGESVSRHIGEGEVVYSFSSAWSPPTPVIERLAEIFPEVKIEFKYMETGCDFWGVEIYENGEMKSEKGGSVNHTAYEVMGWECYQCQSYYEEGETEEYFDYLYTDCPPKVERKKKGKVKK